MLVSFHKPQDRNDSFFNCHHITDLINVSSSEAEADLIKAGRVMLDKRVSSREQQQLRAIVLDLQQA